MRATIVIDHLTTDAVAGDTLFEHAERLGIQVPTSCVKQGKCRECLLEIEEGAASLTPRTPEEEHLGDGFRLACRARVSLTETATASLRCQTMRRGSMRIETASSGLTAIDACIDPAVTRRSGRVFIDDEEVAESPGPIHGIAIDLGTTTVALRLYDLESGRLLATQSFENPQRFGGSDIMARIHFDGSHKGRLLQRTLLGYLRRAIGIFPVSPASIFEVVVAANTTMRDLLFGLDVQSIGQKPYRSVTEHELRDGKRDTTALTMPAHKLRLPVHPRARVYGLPLIGSHVGADAAACLLATGIAERSEISVVMDIGTNTELLLGGRERLIAASCPAGPAFEGGAIACGMPGLDGAIERIAFGDRDGNARLVQLEVIGQGIPRGMCGSAMVDLLSELLRTDRMNAQGRYRNDRDCFVVDAEHGIVFLESDINELAQAKGANVAGLQILKDVYGVSFDQVDRFYLAGGFARYLDLEASKRIGLIPDLPAEKFVRVGNASLEGASRALLSRSARTALESKVRAIEHIELETHPAFFDFFVDGCQFMPIGVHVS